MEEYRVELKVKNNYILTRIEQAGYRSPLEFCSKVNVSYHLLMKYINLKLSIYDHKGQIKRSVHNICDALNAIPEELFSAQQAEMELKTNKRTKLVNEAEVMFMLHGQQEQKLLEEIVEQDQFEESIQEALNSLSDINRKVIEMRMGLGEDGQQYTLDEIADHLGVTRERIRQREAQALRHLRNPYRSQKLRQFLQDDD